MYMVCKGLVLVMRNRKENLKCINKDCNNNYQTFSHLNPFDTKK